MRVQLSRDLYHDPSEKHPNGVVLNGDTQYMSEAELEESEYEPCPVCFPEVN